jgi:hypothetical protein
MLLIFQIVLIVILSALFLLVFFLSKKYPSNERDWSHDQKILPLVEFNGNKIIVKNVRHITYQTSTDYSVIRNNREYDLDMLKKVWIFLVHFTGYKFAAHTFLSFEFENGNFVCVSVEIRKKKGEKYSAVKGLFRQFELMYVIADERDVVRLRTDHHKDNVFLYPLKLSKKQSQELFCDMLKRANTLAKKPEFYHSISNACFGNIVTHLNGVLPQKLPFDHRVFLPENADKYLYDFELIDTELPFSKIREKHKINAFAEKYADDPEFSRKIRGR